MVVEKILVLKHVSSCEEEVNFFDGSAGKLFGNFEKGCSESVKAPTNVSGLVKKESIEIVVNRRTKTLFKKKMVFI